MRPTKDSLIGRYIQDTGAKTAVRAFPFVGNGRYGRYRLVVALSEASFPAFVKYFAREEFLALVGHAILMHNGEVVGIRFDELRVPHIGTLLPFVVLKTTEGQRTTQYFELFRKLGGGWFNVAAQPWMLPGYCAQGGYTCCTQWIGNMPIGDKLVDSYSFPGVWESGEPARTQVLAQYEHPDPLVRRVWTVPGHQQFANVIGQGRANLRGNFAATSLVASTLIGPTDIERVPVLFRVVRNHRAWIPSDSNYFIPQ